MHYEMYYTANAHMKDKHSLDAGDHRMYPSGKAKKKSQSFPCKVDNCDTDPCRTDKRTRFKSAKTANTHMRKLNVDSTMLYSEQDASSAVQAEVTTLHIQTSMSYSTSTHTVQTYYTHTHRRKGKASSAGHRQR